MEVARVQERLAAQRAEAAANPAYGQTFKAQASKDDKKARRKQILANIGAGALLLLQRAWLVAGAQMTSGLRLAALEQSSCFLLCHSFAAALCLFFRMYQLLNADQPLRWCILRRRGPLGGVS